MQNLKQINAVVFKLHGNKPTHTQIPSEFYLYRLSFKVKLNEIENKSQNETWFVKLSCKRYIFLREKI